MTVDGTATTAATFNTNVNGSQIRLNDGTSSTQPWDIGIKNDGSNDFIIYNLGAENLEFYNANKLRQKISLNGDISFYDDTGTTQGLFWDASAESLGIGTTSPSAFIHTEGTSNGTETYAKFSTGSLAGDQILTVKSSSARNHMALQVNAGGGAVDDLALNPDGGNVGIGRSSPQAKLEIRGSESINGFGVGAILSEGLVNTSSSYLVLGDQQGVALRGVHTGTFGRKALAFYTSNNTDSGNFDPEERMRIDSSGNVGIGRTSNLRDILTLNKSDTTTTFGASTAAIDITNSYASAFNSYSGVNFRVGAGSYNESLASIQAQYTSYSGNVMGELVFGTRQASTTNVTEAMRIDSSGNVGIGTTSPSSALDVVGSIRTSNGSGTVYNQFANAGNDVIWENRQNGNIIIRSNNSNERMRITSAGNVGIGTNNPASKLEVKGSGTSPIVYFGNGVDNAPNRQLAFSGGSSGLVWDLDATGASSVGGQLTFSTNSSERMRIDSSGNVGIGVSSPTRTLQIVSTGTTTGGTYLYSNAIHTGTDTQSLLSVRSDNASATGTVVDIRGDGTGDILHVKDGTNTALIVEDGGNVGIGTDNPSSLLHLSSSAPVLTVTSTSGTGGTHTIKATGINGDALQITAENDIYLNGDNIYFRKADETQHMRLTSTGNLGIGTTSPSAKLHLNTSDTTATYRIQGATSAAIDFYNSTTKNGALLVNSSTFLVAADNSNPIVFNTGGSERARIDSSGNLLIGQTAGNVYNQSSVSGFKLDGSSGNLQVARSNGTPAFFNRLTSDGTMLDFRRDGTTVGSISVTASATAYNTSSDARLKDVTGEARGLEVITKLNPVAYNWKADGKADEGLIAQEVKEIVPNAVSGSEDEHYQMDYSKLVTHLVAGMKEQQEQIESLKSEIAKLKGE